MFAAGFVDRFLHVGCAEKALETQKVRAIINFSLPIRMPKILQRSSRKYLPLAIFVRPGLPKFRLTYSCSTLLI